MNTTTPLTIEAAGNLLEHDALLQGYRELLEMAKSQLEAFEISPDDWRRLENKAVHGMDYHQLSVRLADRLELALRDEDRGTSFEEGSAEWIQHKTMLKLLDRLAEPVLKKVREEVIRQEIRAAVQEATKELRADLIRQIESSVERKIEDRIYTEAANARAEHDALESLVQRVFGNQFRRLAKDAAIEVAKDNA